jgi:GH24 family phage-related lysozyme (muramidase)
MRRRILSVKRRILGVVLMVALLFSFASLFAVDANAASDMRASQEIVDMIQSIEGFQAIPYWDYAQWTVGFGTECPEEDLERYRAEGIPVEEAQALFAKHMVRHENAVNKFIDKYGLTLNQAQFDALISYTYNLGPNTLNKDTYTIVQAITSGATGNELVYAFSIYCMAGGEFQPGLMRRRLAEANLWFHGEYGTYPPESYCYVHYDANGGVRDASAQGYDCNMPATPMSRPTKEGYTFVGWYTAAEGGVKITSLDETTMV